jgi:glycine dehydrogenase subunit 1
VHGGAFFREFVLECPVPAADVVKLGVAKGILPGVDLGQFRPEWSRHLLVAVTEKRSAEEIERWAQLLEEAGSRR